MKFDAQKLNVGLNIFVIVGLAISVVLAGVVMKDSYDNALLLSNTKELAQELRQPHGHDRVRRICRSMVPVTGQDT